MKDRYFPFGIVLLVLAVVAVGVQVWLAFTGQGSFPAGHGGGFHPGFFFPFGPLLLAAGFFFWVRRRSPREALEVLAVEYAQGRIDRDEYLSRKAVLEDRG